MRILADENLPRSVVENLRSAGHDILWARLDFPGVKDRALLDRAETEGRVIVTLDKDFLQLALQRRVPLKRAGVILVRVIPAIPKVIGPLLDSALRSQQNWISQVSVVTKDGIETFPL